MLYSFGITACLVYVGEKPRIILRVHDKASPGQIVGRVGGILPTLADEVMQLCRRELNIETTNGDLIRSMSIRNPYIDSNHSHMACDTLNTIRTFVREALQSKPQDSVL